MPRSSAINFGDLVGKLDVLYVVCSKCERHDRYPVRPLIKDRGRNVTVINWLNEITADCPKRHARKPNDACGARCPDLPKVMSLLRAPAHRA